LKYPNHRDFGFLKRPQQVNPGIIPSRKSKQNPGKRKLWNGEPARLLTGICNIEPSGRITRESPPAIPLTAWKNMMMQRK
jgi:hypothetical protein